MHCWIFENAREGTQYWPTIALSKELALLPAWIKSLSMTEISHKRFDSNDGLALNPTDPLTDLLIFIPAFHQVHQQGRKQHAVLHEYRQCDFAILPSSWLSQVLLML